MKKKSLLSIALLGIGALTLAACSNHVQTVVGSAERVYDYGVYDTENLSFNYGSHGNRYVKTEMTVTSGKVSACTFHEVYGATAWARLTDEQVTSFGEDNYLAVENYFDADDTSGTTRKTVYFAKHIRVGEYVFEGRVRTYNAEAEDQTDNTYINEGEVIAWKWVGIDPTVTNSSTYPYDLAVYLPLETGYTYLLRRRVLWYFEQLEKGEAKILSTYSSETQSGTEVAPNYPGGNYYRDASDETYKSTLESLGNYFVGKTISYRESTTDTETVRTVYSLQTRSGFSNWCYNPQYSKGVIDDNAWEEITGVGVNSITRSQLNRYFTSANICFASVEFASLI